MSAGARGALAGGLLVLELYLAVRYRAFGAAYHHLLHGWLGAAAGLVAWTAAAARGRRPAVPVWAAAVAGHLVSALPDVLFLAADEPHRPWMDVFVGHITAHLVPGRLWWALGVFTVAVLAAAATVAGARRSALAGAVAVVVAAGLGFATAEPLPRTLQDLRARPELACVLPSAGVYTRPDAGIQG